MSRSGYGSAAAVLLGPLLLFGPASLLALAGVALLAAVSWAVVRTAGAFRDGYAA
ncbi:hypothetical protein U3A55_05875 [Salarchaeum sp. III]|uniref:hypothetical protein n=1 Tax=Salarchaeum sp. III TaxID=3107927 RepID=UPI002ED8BB0C